MREHLFLEVGPCFGVILGIEDGPVVGSRLGEAEQSSRRVGKRDFVGPNECNFHSFDTLAPSDDVDSIFIFFSVENQDLLLVKLHDLSMGSCCHWGYLDVSGGSS